MVKSSVTKCRQNLFILALEPARVSCVSLNHPFLLLVSVQTKQMSRKTDEGAALPPGVCESLRNVPGLWPGGA